MNGVVSVALLIFVLVLIHSVDLTQIIHKFIGDIFSVPVFEGGPLAEWFNLAFKLLYLALLIYVIRVLVVRR